MQYKLPSDSPKKRKSLGITMIQSVVRHTALLVAEFTRSSLLVSSDDKQSIARHLRELMNSINDIASRSSLHEVRDDIAADSSDEKMIRYMRMETDTLQGIIQSTLHIVDRLHVTNRMDDAHYRQLQKYFKSVAGMHSALLKKLVTSTQ